MSPAERAARTAAARAARDAKRALQVDPDETLSARERAKRVKALEKADMAEMRLKAKRARREQRVRRESRERPEGRSRDSPAAQHYSVSVNTIKGWQRRHGDNRANAATHVENKTGAVDDVSPAQLRSIAARLSQTLDRYLTSGQTVRIGPLSRAVGDLVRAAEKLATLPPVGEVERLYGAQMAQIITWTLTELGLDAHDPAIGPILRHNMLKVGGSASESELRKAWEESRQAMAARADRHQEKLRRVLAEFDEKDKSRRRNALADGCPTCGRGPESDAQTSTTGSAPKALPAPDQHKQGPVAEHLIGADAERVPDEEVGSGEIV